MITVKHCDDSAAWNELIIQNDGHPLQLWGWGEVKSRHGWTADRLIVMDENEAIGGLQVLTRQLPFPFHAFSYIPRGSLFHVKHEESLEAIAAHIKQKYKGVALSLEPDSYSFDKPSKWVRATNKILPAETILLDLNKDEDVLQREMAKKTRQYIRKSAKEVEIRQVTSDDDFEKCLNIYKDTAKRANFSLHRDEYYRDVKICLDDHSPIFAAYVNDEPVAFLWLAISGATAYELYGGVNEVGQKLRANYALKWHTITKVKQWGLTNYDFGGVISGGVTTFKQGWVGESVSFAGTYDRPFSPLYALWSHALPLAKRTAQSIRKIIKR